jgi:hypothetical protein
MTRIVLPDGRQLEQLSDASFKLLDIDGAPLGYVVAKVVEYRPTLEAEYAAQRLRGGA